MNSITCYDEVEAPIGGTETATDHHLRNFEIFESLATFTVDEGKIRIVFPSLAELGQRGNTLYYRSNRKLQMVVHCQTKKGKSHRSLRKVESLLGHLLKGK